MRFEPWLFKKSTGSLAKSVALSLADQMSGFRTQACGKIFLNLLVDFINLALYLGIGSILGWKINK